MRLKYNGVVSSKGKNPLFELNPLQSNLGSQSSWRGFNLWKRLHLQVTYLRETYTKFEVAISQNLRHAKSGSGNKLKMW